MRAIKFTSVFLLTAILYAQNWTWVGGNLGSADSRNLIAIPGTKGAAGSSHYPGSRDGALSWTDKDGNFWLFGGHGFVGANNSQSAAGKLNDFWKYDLSTGFWTWMGGNLGSTDAKNLIASPGTKGVPASSNYPGSRTQASTWTDNDGNLWLFGGYGPVGVNNSQSAGGQLNDFWKYDISTGYWTWVGGDLGNSDARKQVSVGGTKGVASSTNYPGSRNYAVSWTDNDGNLWMFGGWGFVGPNNSQNAAGYLNDLWKYDISTGYWTWFGGDLVSNQSPGKIAVPGTKGIPASLNFPGGKTGATSWTDNDGNLWLFGGEGKTGNNQSQAQWGYLNDLWKYDLSTGHWTWISGFLGSLESRNRVGDPGTKGSASSGNYPGGTAWSASWVSNDGELWIFGGTGYIGSGDPGTFGRHNSLWNYDFDQSAVFATNNSELMGLIYGEGRWGDYDNDGDTDLIICGQTADSSASVTRLYQNEPIGRLIEDTNQDLIGLKAGAFRFADLDSDGDKDLIMSGWNNLENSLVTKIYINEPVGTFTLSDDQINFVKRHKEIIGINLNENG